MEGWRVGWMDGLMDGWMANRQRLVDRSEMYKINADL